MNTSNPRRTHISWIKEGFLGLAPQASALARLRHSPILKNNVFIVAQGVLAAARRFAIDPLNRASEGPFVTKALPGFYKLAENTRQTCRVQRVRAGRAGFDHHVA